jgi:hypothetical protein
MTDADHARLNNEKDVFKRVGANPDSAYFTAPAVMPLMR